ncbi:hypothetical protein ES703_33492 [subsurface metagenome]
MKYLRKRWHGIPIAILVAVLITVLAAGSVMAAYTAWTGTAEVNVEEALRVDLIDGRIVTRPIGDDSAKALWDGTTLTVSGLMPGEWVAASINVLNDSSVDLSVTAKLTQIGDGTIFQAGTLEDSQNAALGGPVPTYSWITLCRVVCGNPITFDAPANGALPTPGGPVIALQAGTEIIPGDYTFQLTVER